MMVIPPGIRFVPTEEELVTLFLRNKTMGFQLPFHNVVIERNLYGEFATPWLILREDDPSWQIVVDPSSCKYSTTKKVIYVITKLSRVGKGDKNTQRTAGCGTWHASSKPKPIKNGKGDQIGTMRMLNYKYSECESEGHWIMHEYALAGELLNGVQCKDYVICRITRIMNESNKGTTDDDHRDYDDDGLMVCSGLGKRKECCENQEIVESCMEEGQAAGNKRRAISHEADQQNQDQVVVDDQEIGGDELYWKSLIDAVTNLENQEHTTVDSSKVEEINIEDDHVVSSSCHGDQIQVEEIPGDEFDWDSVIDSVTLDGNIFQF